MSKYNLMDIYEGMSDKEFSAAEEAGRLKKHPEKDKIQKIKDLMSKEKSIDNTNEGFTKHYSPGDSLYGKKIESIELVDKKKELYKITYESGKTQIVQATSGMKFSEKQLFDKYTSGSIKELDSTFKEGDKVSVFMRGTKSDSPESATIVMMDPSGVAIVRNKEGQEDEVFIKDMNQIKENKKEEQLKTAYAALDKAEQDGDIRKQELALAAIDLIKGDIKENNIEEMTGEIYRRIDGLINQNLKMEFIDKFIAIQDDLIEDGENFDSMDLIDYLASELQKFGEDARMFEEARPGYNADGTPKSNDEMSDDEREAFYNDSDFIDEDESLKEHFGRFMKDYQ